MRPIPAGMLDAVAEETHLNPLAHGAPVHIGDPGINDTHTHFTQDSNGFTVT